MWMNLSLRIVCANEGVNGILSNMKRSFEVNSIIVFTIMMIANVFNYLYQIVMGNALTVSDFGNLNTLLSLSVVISVPSGILQLITAQYTAYYQALGEMGKMRRLLHSLLQIAGIATAIAFLIGLGFTGLISNVIKIKQTRDILVVVAVISLSCIISVTSGKLQGLKRFVTYGIVGIVSSMCKLLFGMILVWLGIGLFGNILALLVGSILVIMYSFYTLKHVLRDGYSIRISLDRADITRYFRSVFWVQLFTAILVNGDILLIRTFVTYQAEAGIYASGMVFGKISMYMATAVITTLFPVVAEQQTQGRHTKALFSRAMLFGGGISIAFAAGLNIVRWPLITMLFSTRYSLATTYLLPISCFVVTVTLLSIRMNYLMVRGETGFLTLSMGSGYMLILIQVWFFHASVSQILLIMSAVLFVVFIRNVPRIFTTQPEV